MFSLTLTRSGKQEVFPLANSEDFMLALSLPNRKWTVGPASVTGAHLLLFLFSLTDIQL